MGSYNGSVEADLEYPLAFMENMARVLEETRPVAAEGRPPFQYVQLSGMFVRRDQDSRLWVNEKTRKLKVRKELAPSPLGIYCCPISRQALYHHYISRVASPRGLRRAPTGRPNDSS